MVILWHERLTAGEHGADAAKALLRIAELLKMADRECAGLLEIPAFSNGRGLREAGMLSNAGPGYGDAPQGRDGAAIAAALGTGELSTLYLLGVDPLIDLPGRELWQEGLGKATSVIAHASLMTEGLREHASVIFPAESYAEKDGTIVHPDSRVQRLRAAIARPGEVRAGWAVITELAKLLGLDLNVMSAAQASERLFQAVPFYAGLTLDEIGGRGVRWSERPQADSLAQGGSDQAAPQSAALDAAELAGWRSLWDAPEVEASPALEFAGRARELV